MQKGLPPAAAPRASGAVSSWPATALPSLTALRACSGPVSGSCSSLERPEDRGLALPHPQILGSGAGWAQHYRLPCPSPSWRGLGRGATKGGSVRWPRQKQTWAARRGPGSCPGNPPANSARRDSSAVPVSRRSGPGCLLSAALRVSFSQTCLDAALIPVVLAGWSTIAASCSQRPGTSTTHPRSSEVSPRSLEWAARLARKSVLPWRVVFFVLFLSNRRFISVYMFKA